VASNATARRDGQTLALAGGLDRDAVTAVWPQLVASLAGARVLDVSAVDFVDSAGVALLSELVDRLRAQAGDAPRIIGSPTGLAELTAAYRLTPQLDFQASSPPAVN
jgi:phospholipid transport system transporter-binding protein